MRTDGGASGKIGSKLRDDQTGTRRFSLTRAIICPVDEVDRSILMVLEADGRISNAELAARVGLSASPCLRRVRRLEESGVIRGYRAVIDSGAVGRGLRVFAGVRLSRHIRADVTAFERTVTQLPEVAYCHHVTGNFDYLLQIEVADLPAYENFHAHYLASLPGIAAVTSYATLKTLSHDE